MNKKISVIGAGNVGSTVAFLLALKNIGDVVLLDIDEGKAQGKAMDINHASTIEGSLSSVIGTSSFKATEGSDVVVVTSGFSCRNGFTSRSDLLELNVGIVREVAGSIAKHSPEAFVIMVTNPLDTMTWLAKEVTQLPPHRIVGMGAAWTHRGLATF